jgi:hypothetical protein
VKTFRLQMPVDRRSRHKTASDTSEFPSWWLPAKQSLYLTSLVLRALTPNLPYSDQKGGWKSTKLIRIGLYAHEALRSSFHHNNNSLFYTATAIGLADVNFRLSLKRAKITLINLITTAHIASFFFNSCPQQFFVFNFLS